MSENGCKISAPSDANGQEDNSTYCLRKPAAGLCKFVL